MQHVHMSTGFAFVLAFFVVGLVSVLLAFVHAWRKATIEAKRYHSDPATRGTIRIVRPTQEDIDAFIATDAKPTYTPGIDPRPRSGVVREGRWDTPVSPAYYAAPPVYAHDPFSGLATGMILGSALSHHDTVVHDTTIVHDSAPSHSSYSDSSSSYSSSSSDSGFSYSDSSSSSSYDSGSSGGFDASW